MEKIAEFHSSLSLSENSSVIFSDNELSERTFLEKNRYYIILYVIFYNRGPIKFFWKSGIFIRPVKKRDKSGQNILCPFFSKIIFLTNFDDQKKKRSTTCMWKSGTNDKDAGLRDRGQKASSVPPKS